MNLVKNFVEIYEHVSHTSIDWYIERLFIESNTSITQTFD